MRPIKQFQDDVLAWYQQHGRHDLPWQRIVTPYRIWISEIMLQQTQVGTVIPYFERFISRFPDVETVASASVDEVLLLWSGLGYYSRARNLHRSARMLVASYGGIFPKDIHELEHLPGIGRSTAGAILSFGLCYSAPILDGNVKRLFIRYHALTGDKASLTKKLWSLAEQYTPKRQFIPYNQAMMDLGAMVCTRKNPNCPCCPLRETCLSHLLGYENDLPRGEKKKTLPVHRIFFLILRNASGAVWLEKRSASGIWGGLFCFPVKERGAKGKVNWPIWCRKAYGFRVRKYQMLSSFRHTLTHCHFDICPVLIDIEGGGEKEVGVHFWYDLQKPLEKGIPKPVRDLLRRLKNGPNG